MAWTPSRLLSLFLFAGTGSKAWAWAIPFVDWLLTFFSFIYELPHSVGVGC